MQNNARTVMGVLYKHEYIQFVAVVCSRTAPRSKALATASHAGAHGPVRAGLPRDRIRGARRCLEGARPGLWGRIDFLTSLALRTFSSDNNCMKGNEFIRKVKALGKVRKVTVTLNASRGKGSHQTLYYVTAFTIIRNPKDELKSGTYHAMCKQLGVKPGDL